MHIVVKNTKSINEFKMKKDKMEHDALKMFEEHKKAFESWRFGNIETVWYDNDGYLCIEYESGDWWHYNEKGEWW